MKSSHARFIRDSMTCANSYGSFDVTENSRIKLLIELASVERTLQRLHGDSADIAILFYA